MFDIEFKRIKPVKVIHKLSDTNNAVVFSIKAMLDGEETECILKILKLFYHHNEIELFLQKPSFVPDLIEYDRSQRYIVYGTAYGKGYLHTSDNQKEEVIRSSALMLSKIHHLVFDKPSRRNEIVDKSAKRSKLYKSLPCIAEHIDNYVEYGTDHCFIHGDYHAMNLMFDKNGSVVSVIDWEYCGLYYKEYDLAYAVVPRMDLYSNINDVKMFLDTYGWPFNKGRFLYFYYLTACYVFEDNRRCSDEDFFKVVSDVTELMRSGE